MTLFIKGSRRHTRRMSTDYTKVYTSGINPNLITEYSRGGNYFDTISAIIIVSAIVYTLISFQKNLYQKEEHQKNIRRLGAKHHHERYDGKGYPDKLKGTDIPELARIISVADAYDAMTSKRSYRDPIPQQLVREEFVKGSGTQFDPNFARCMLYLIDHDLNYDLKEKIETALSVYIILKKHLHYCFL